jgi:hypothetical protein
MDKVHKTITTQYCWNVLKYRGAERSSCVPNGSISTGITALRKIRTGSKINELRNSGALPYKVRCQWEDRVRQVVHRLDGGHLLDSTQDRYQINNLEETRTFENTINSIANL